MDVCNAMRKKMPAPVASPVTKAAVLGWTNPSSCKQQQREKPESGYATIPIRRDVVIWCPLNID